MQIKIWIRPSGNANTPTMRLDYKFEDRDTPQICRYGKKLLNALEGNMGTESTNVTNDKHDNQ